MILAATLKILTCSVMFSDMDRFRNYSNFSDNVRTEDVSKTPFHAMPDAFLSIGVKCRALTPVPHFASRGEAKTFLDHLVHRLGQHPSKCRHQLSGHKKLWFHINCESIEVNIKKIFSFIQNKTLCKTLNSLDGTQCI